jgi:hypothetical protein
MRPKIRTVLLALVAVVAFGALAAGNASAAEFRVEGKPLTAPEAYTSLGGQTIVVMTIGGTNFRTECKQSAGKGNIEPGGKTSAAITFKECKMTEPAGCKLTAEEENTGIGWGLVGSLEGTGKIFYAGTGSGEEIYSWTVERIAGQTCALTGTFSVAGNFSCEHGVGEAVEQTETCKRAESHLKMGTEVGTASYVRKIKLSSGKKWGIA